MAAGGRAYGLWRQGGSNKVLFFEEEGSAIAAKERLFKVLMGLGYGLSAEKVWLPLPEGIKASDPDRPYDWRPHIAEPDDPVWSNLEFAHDSGIKLDRPSRTAPLLDYIKEKQPGLVVLDSLTFMFNGDENSKQDVARVVDTLKAIRSLGTSVMYLVHLRKNDEDQEDVDKALRGHTILRDAYDCHLACRRPKDRNVIVLHIRYRDGRRKKYQLFWNIPDEGTMGPVKLDLSELPDRKPEAKEAAALPKRDTLVAAGIAPGVSFGAGELATALGISPGRASEFRSRLVTEGVAELTLSGELVLPIE